MKIVVLARSFPMSPYFMWFEWIFADTLLFEANRVRTPKILMSLVFRKGTAPNKKFGVAYGEGTHDHRAPFCFATKIASLKKHKGGV